MKLSRMTGLAVTALLLTALIAAPAIGAQIGSNYYQFQPPRGYFDGDFVYYLLTDVSDSGYASVLHANYSPLLAEALNPVLRVPSGEFMPSMYFVTNFTQRLIFSAQWSSAIPPYPPFLGDYMPLWRLQLATWDPLATPVELTSVADVEFWESQTVPGGDPALVVEDAGIAVAASIIINTDGEKIRQAFVSYKYGYPTVRLPVRQVYLDDLVYKMLQLDFSNTYAARTFKGNYVPLLSKFYKLRLLSEPLVTQPIYSFWPRVPVGQLWVASEAPDPFGPSNTNLDYTPMMNEAQVKLLGVGPFTKYTNADDILDSVYPITTTTYIAYQPVVAVTPPPGP